MNIRTKYKVALATSLVAMLSFTACDDDNDLSDQSIITAKTDTQTTQFDEWLRVNYIDTYNIDFKYRYADVESDMDYYTVPAPYDESVIMAHLLKYLCLEAYDEVAGIEFTRTYFPKMIFLIGEFEYRNNGSFILGTAEGGKKILLTGLNYLSSNLDNIDILNEWYFKTIHHEFTHILNQTKEFSTEFKLISGADYVGDLCFDQPYGSIYLSRGFITDYSQTEATEDFAEMLSTYVCNSPEQWDAWFNEIDSLKYIDVDAKEAAKSKLSQKLAIVRSYMKESWDIDIDELRASINLRQKNVTEGKIKLTDLTINN